MQSWVTWLQGGCGGVAFLGRIWRLLWALKEERSCPQGKATRGQVKIYAFIRSTEHA